MTIKKFHSAVGLLLVLAISLSLPVLPVQAQKKKKSEEPQGIKLREAEFYFTEGEKYFILEDYAKALLYYQRAIEINPENATVHYKVAEVLAHSTKQDDLIRASLSIENALRLEKSNKYFYLLAASIYNGLAKFDKAAEVYEEMMRQVKGTEEYLYEVAAVYQYGNRQEDAFKAYQRAESVFGINEISSMQKMRMLLDAGKTKEGISEGEKLINAFPDEEQFIMNFTEVLSQKGMRDQAIVYLEKFIAANAESGNAKMLLAGFYRDTNQEAKARPLLLALFDDMSIEIGSKLIVLGAYNAELNQNKTKNVADADKETFAFTLFHKLEKNYPENSSVHIIGGDLYLSTGKNREAHKEYLMAVESGEVNFEVWENLLYLEIQLEQFDQAIAHVDEALEIFPNQNMLHYFSGFANLRKHRNQEAIAAFEQAKKLSSSNPALVGEINGMLGDAYNALKDYIKSDKSYEEALAFNQNNYGVLNNYSYFLALRRENLEKAEKMSTQLIKNNPDNPTFLDTHAWVLYVRQKYKDARKVIEKAIGTGKATATHFEHYGDILYQLGDVDGAVQQWEKARGMNAKSETLNKKIANRKIYE
ncbi:MAG: tetratricopeptide repeat protein [Bacteroidota bacterium]